jgi:hypothetical protein
MLPTGQRVAQVHVPQTCRDVCSDWRTPMAPDGSIETQIQQNSRWISINTPRSQCGGQGFDPPRLHSAEPGTCSACVSMEPTRRAEDERALPGMLRSASRACLQSGTSRVGPFFSRAWR